MWIGFFVLGYGQVGLWGEVNRVDQVVFIYDFFFYSGEWNAFRFFQKLEGVETKRSSLTLSVCKSNRGPKLLPKKGHGRRFSNRL